MRFDTHILEHAYRVGVFPMAMEDGEIEWFRPDPRAILPLDKFHCPQSLRRTWRRGEFRVTLDQNFSGVVAGCADRPEGTWISKDIARVYAELHRLGKAHSVEVWHEGKLAGGVYGVHLGSAFFAESKFHRVTDASKIALWALAESLRTSNFELLEVQYLTPHLQKFGCVEVSLADYFLKLEPALASARTLALAPQFAGYGVSSSNP